jgi:hypothetical protein
VSTNRGDGTVQCHVRRYVRAPSQILGKLISCRTISLDLNTRRRALDTRGHDPVGMGVRVLAVRLHVHTLHRRTKGVARVDHGAAEPEPQGVSIYITAVDIRRFVGMATNASPMTESQWERHLGTIAVDQCTSSR